MITAAIGYVRYMSRSAEELRIRLGVDAGELDALETEIAQRTQAAVQAYEARESRELTGSEEEHTVKVGFFKENARTWPKGMISAVRQDAEAAEC